jgi:hypothetical protein
MSRSYPRVIGMYRATIGITQRQYSSCAGPMVRRMTASTANTRTGHPGEHLDLIYLQKGESMSGGSERDTDEVLAGAEASVAAPSLDALYAAQDAALRAWEGCAHGWEVQCEHRIGFDVAWRALGDALESQAKAQEGP